jgi:hypothetical protein
VNAGDLRPPPKAHTPWWVHLLYWSGIAAAAGWAVREHFWPARRLAFAGFSGDMPKDNNIVERTAEPAAATDTWGSSEQYWQHPVDEPALSLDLTDVLPEVAHTDIELDLPKPPEEPVDPSISAGVFVAFGRFDEAERLLREALLQNRDRVDLELQLLDVYLQSDQAEAFESLAQSIEEKAAAMPEVLAEVAVLRDSYHMRR